MVKVLKKTSNDSALPSQKRCCINPRLSTGFSKPASVFHFTININRFLDLDSEMIQSSSMFIINISSPTTHPRNQGA
jgi:hypothetical protein